MSNNEYYRVRLDFEPWSQDACDLMAGCLADIGYDSFVSDERGLDAYVAAGVYDEEALCGIISDFAIQTQITHSAELVPTQDWNEVWEQNSYTPIVIDRRCVIHGSGHIDVPVCDYDVVINPKMSFGTGHHATTVMMCRRLLSLPWNAECRRVIDVGTGTGVLSILASKLGATDVTAIEIDLGACDNAADNVAVNGCEGVSVLLGDAHRLDDVTGEADVLLANINRNIILGDIARYVASVREGGCIILSGFYKTDIDVIVDKAASVGLTYDAGATLVDDDDEWACITLVKNKGNNENMSGKCRLSRVLTMLAALLMTAVSAMAVAPADATMSSEADVRRPLRFAWGAELGGMVDLSGHEMSAVGIDAMFGMQWRWVRFFGIGAGADVMVTNSSRTFPLTVNFRTDFSSRRRLLFADLRGGVALSYLDHDRNETLPYASGGVGVTLASGRTFSSHIILAYTYLGQKECYLGERLRHCPGGSMVQVRLGVSF